jgi:hypothetical protein
VAALFKVSRVRLPLTAWMLVFCVCCELCRLEELIIGSEESCPVCVFNCVRSGNFKRVSLDTIWAVATEQTINAATNSLAPFGSKNTLNLSEASSWVRNQTT